jgi:hypothetical protein
MAKVDRAKGRICTLEGCDKPWHQMGLCRPHYNKDY